MRNLPPIYATIVSVISAAIGLCVGISMLHNRRGGEIGLLISFVGVPGALANAGVFHHVAKALHKNSHSVTSSDDSNLSGTPWEKDPGHTLK